ncbi:zinc finger BED domain-containing protein RICESLEEPER 2-like [Rhizophagus irregularis DAOM 181602=DAOM 197198]|nr:zinc finger BED domain-containing protein RICESLEEPER 2-like [Rhizophagus irregularis DAOM 181602=DAOM 197198]
MVLCIRLYRLSTTDFVFFDSLVRMVKDYLSIQATSVPSEQVFSIAKNTINPTRNRLFPEKARMSLCLKSWLDNGLINLQK